MPILPGKTEAWKQFVRTLGRERLSEYDDSRKRAGIKKEVAWLQQTPHGDHIVVYIEAKDLAKVFDKFAKSQEPFDAWFRKMVLDIHGLDLTAPPHPPKLGWEWQSS